MKQKSYKREVKRALEKLVARRKRQNWRVSKKKKKKKKKNQEWDKYKKDALKNKSAFYFFLNIKISEKTLQFNDIILNKKEFYRFKEPIDLFSVNVDEIVLSEKFKHIKKVFKNFIGYREGEIVKPLCIILPQMSGYIKYF